MNFEDVLKQMKKSYSVFTRMCKDWEEKQSSIVYNEATNSIEYEYVDDEGIRYISLEWEPTHADILANDWVEI